MKLSDDPFVRELLPEFVDNWLADIDSQFDNLIQQRNHEDLYRFAHTLKGSCFQFGLDHIAHLGIELMGYAKEKNWEKAQQMKDVIQSAFVEVRDYLKNNPL
ncbi:Hpt domain-containing protein [Bacteroidetes/Chlorobi group bacterium Naka2016]|jgi:HPt (histidine-containing phosphotransfer) domain-containing protein|nr:MAG: Hpt domain-containing protein [Bacteroidetes/Chlorobi group bacterium Naka2016]